MPSHPFARRDVAEDDDPDAALAARIAALRRAAGWGLTEASARTGISRSAISKLERNEMSPTYQSIRRLAKGYNVSMDDLLLAGPQPEQGIQVLRAKDHPAHTVGQYRIRPLGDTAGRCAVLEVEVLARAAVSFDTWDRHDDRDFLVVTAGEVAVQFETGEEVVLVAGDRLCFDARIGHKIYAPRGEGATMLLLTEPN